MLAEAVVFLDPALAEGFKYVRKQSAQLSSKMRFVAAQFTALLADDLWRKNASHANGMAAALAEGVRDIPGVRITQAVDANEVFAVLPHDAIERLQAEFDFYAWDERAGEVRWVASWDTTEEDVARFVAAIERVMTAR
jgi:threonine aldolase